MIRRQTLVSAICFGILALTTPTMGKESSAKLFYQSKQIQLATPIVIKQNTAYFPVRDILKPFKAKMNYSRREAFYTVDSASPAFSSKFFVHSKELWINENQEFMSAPVILHENRVYVPLRSFFRHVGIGVSKKGHNYYLNASRKKRPVQKASTHTLANLGKGTKLTPTQFKMKPIPTTQKLYLRLGKTRYSLKHRFLFKNQRFYVNLSPMLKQNGYTIRDRNGRITISNHRKSLSLSKSKNPNDLLIYRGHTYIRFRKFLRAFQLKAIYRPSDNTVTVLNQIERISMSKNNHQYGLNIVGTGKLYPQKATLLDWPKRMYIDIPNTRLEIKQRSQTLDHPVFKKITLSQHTVSTTRIALEITEDLHAAISPIQTGAKATLLPLITNLTETRSGNRIKVSIKGTLPFSVHASKFQNPPRLILDIPKSYTNLPLSTQSSYGVYRQIRSSQLTLSPPRSRIVFDLNKSAKYQIKQNNSRHVDIYFSGSSRELRSIPSKKIAKTPPKSAKKPAKKPRPKKQSARQRVSKKKPAKSSTQKKSTLKHKLIVIDAGHGGADPGGIGRIGYEKVYTLDISNRLKRMLEAQGARVIMARKGNQNPSLRKRTNIANRYRAHMLVSVHINSFGSPKANGTGTFYYKFKDKILARHIHREMQRSLKLKNNGVQRAKFYVLAYSNMPAVLVEPLFITNPKESRLLKRPEYRERIARSIAKGIANYYKN